MKDILGIGVIVGGTIGILAYLPQVIHLIKVKDSKSISLPAWFLWLVAQVPILAYMIYIKDIYLMIMQSFNALFLLIVIVLSLYYRKSDENIT